VGRIHVVLFLSSCEVSSSSGGYISAVCETSFQWRSRNNGGPSCEPQLKGIFCLPLWGWELILGIYNHRGGRP